MSRSKSSKSPDKNNRKNLKSSKLNRDASTRYFTLSRVVKLMVILSILTGVSYIAVLDSKIVERFSGKIWKLPAKVYARPLELYQNKMISTSQLDYELKTLNYTQVDTIPANQGEYRKWDSYYEVKTRDFDFWDGFESSRVLHIEIRNNTVVALRDIYSNKNINLVRFDPFYISGIFPEHMQDRNLLKVENIPELFLKTLILIEDRRFFDHYGVDIRAVSRALYENLKAGRTVQGGSTLTQQLVKNLFLSPDRNYIRKINEAIMSLLLEFHYDKKTILETYINEVYLGQDRKRAIHGFGLASLHVFGVPLHQLVPDEMAVLVAMVKGPSYYDPRSHPARAKTRRDTVLKLMAENELLTSQQAKDYSAKAIRVRDGMYKHSYPAFMDLVKRQLRNYYDLSDLRTEGLNIFTTLDPYVQHINEVAIKKGVSKLDTNHDGLQAASVIVAPDSGDVLSVVGDYNPAYDGFNRALDARRPIGSLIKPVVYLSALTDKKYSLASLLSDTPLKYVGSNKKSWQPENFDKDFLGDVLLFDAFITSRNVPAARLGLDVGVSKVASMAKALGFTRDINHYPSLTLGAIDMSPFEVAAIYQTFAANGFSSPLNSVISVQDNHGILLQRYPLEVEQVADLNTISLVNFTLQQVTEKGTARRLKKLLTVDTAGKTGTSDDLKDSWFAGFSRDHVAVVWLGKDNNTPTGLTGASGALRIWADIIKPISFRDFKPELTSDLDFYYIDRKSGLLAEKSCVNAIQLPFIKGTQPKTADACAKYKNEPGWFDQLFNDD